MCGEDDKWSTRPKLGIKYTSDVIHRIKHFRALGCETFGCGFYKEKSIRRMKGCLRCDSIHGKKKWCTVCIEWIETAAGCVHMQPRRRLAIHDLSDEGTQGKLV